MDEIERKLTYGLPLTQEECQQLFFEARGRSIPKRWRCRECDGHGVTRHPVEPAVANPAWWTDPPCECSSCHGAGYLEVK